LSATCNISALYFSSYCGGDDCCADVIAVNKEETLHSRRLAVDDTWSIDNVISSEQEVNHILISYV
jgi:hypothetical protein